MLNSALLVVILVLLVLLYRGVRTVCSNQVAIAKILQARR